MQPLAWLLHVGILSEQNTVTVLRIQRVGFKLGLNIQNPETCLHILTINTVNTVFVSKHPQWVESRPVLWASGKFFSGNVIN